MNLTLFSEEDFVTEPSANICPVDEIEILGRKYKIELMGEVEDPESDGSMDLSSQAIKYRPAPGADYNRDTIFHEITHAVDETLLCELTERQVHLMATGLLSVLKQNPELIEWLCSNEQ